MMTKPPDNSQHDRFKQLARELGCDEDEAAFEEALRKVAKRKTAPQPAPPKRKPARDEST